MADALLISQVLTAHLESVSSADSATSSAVGYLLGYAPLGIFALVMSWLSFKGWRLISPAGEDEMRKSAREQARADLLRENERLAADKDKAIERAEARAGKAEADLNAALRFTAERTAPMLEQFVGATSNLTLSCRVSSATPSPLPDRIRTIDIYGRHHAGDGSPGRPGTP